MGSKYALILPGFETAALNSCIIIRPVCCQCRCPPAELPFCKYIWRAFSTVFFFAWLFPREGGRGGAAGGRPAGRTGPRGPGGGARRPHCEVPHLPGSPGRYVSVGPMNQHIQGRIFSNFLSKFEAPKHTMCILLVVFFFGDRSRCFSPPRTTGRRRARRRSYRFAARGR